MKKGKTDKRMNKKNLSLTQMSIYHKQNHQYELLYLI